MATKERSIAPVRGIRRGKVRLVEEIIESLRQDIVTRRFPQGGKLPTERALADRFGVSQPTVREAMRALETLGLVEARHGSGSYVRGEGNYGLASALQTLLQLERVGMLEVLAVRQVLGRASVRMAAEQATPERVATIRAAIAQLDNLRSATSLDEVIRRIIEFQSTVALTATNPLLNTLEILLITLLIEVQVKALRQKGIAFWRERATEYQKDRVAIADAIERGSATDAERAIDVYFDHQRKQFETDPGFADLKFSDQRLIATVANMMQQIKLL